MTDEEKQRAAAPETPAPESPDPPPPRPRRRRWPWVLGLLAALLLVLAFVPTLLGGALLSRFGGPAGLNADRVGGPLWAPELGGVKLTVPGVQATAGEVGVTLAGINPAERTVRLNVRVADAEVALRLQDLISGAGSPAAGDGWRVVLGKLDVQRTRVTVDGSGVNVPDGQFTVQPQPNGALAVTGRTREGQLSAKVGVSEGAAGNIFTLDLDADARVLNHYWPGVTAGRITGRYVLGDGPVRGDLQLRNGAVRVPEAAFVTVSGLGGAATHRGDLVTLNLTGRGWNGPVTAQGRIDLRARNWRVTADASPTLAGLAGALGTTGQGQARVRVTAGGWSTVRVKAYVQGAGEVAGVGLRDVDAEYTFLNQDGNVAGQTNDIAFSGLTTVAGAQQRVEGRWAFGRKGRVTVAGVLAQKPLDVTATIDAQNVVRARGQGLGGPLRATFRPQGQRIEAALNPTFGAAGARVTLAGTPQNLRAQIENGLAGPFALSGTAAYDARGLRADLKSGPSGTARLNLNPDLKGTWAVQGLPGAGLNLTGAGRIDLTGGDVTGRLQATVPGVRDTLTGNLDLNYVQQRGTFAAGQQALTWNGDGFGVRARDLALAGDLRVTGDVTVTTALKVFGSLRAVGNGVSLSAFGRGTAASVRGEVGGVTVLADTDLRAPYRTSARVQGTDIRGTLTVQEDGAVAFDLLTAGQTARGVLRGDNLTATGRVNLAALRPLARVDDLNGTLDLNLAGQGGTAAVNAQALGAEVQGTLTRQAGALSANLLALYKGARARVAGRVFPDVQASGRVSAQGQTLNLTVNGPYSALQTAVSGRTGELSFGGVTLPAQAVNLRGTLTPRLSASGRWGDLNLTYDGASGLTRVQGAQALTAFGQAGRVQGAATWGLGAEGAFRGAVEARGVLDQYAVILHGPWNGLNLVLTDGEGLRAVGTASLPSGRYDVDVSGPLGGGLFVNGNVQGTGLSPRGQVQVRDAAGGRATVTLNGFDNLQVQATGLTLAGQRLAGNLSAKGGVLSGTLNAGPLTLRASGGGVRVTGQVAGQDVVASGRLTLPATLSDLQVQVTGPYLSAQASGGVANLRGTVTLKPQAFGTGATRLSIPAQTFALSGSLTGARARLGGLTYAAGTWGGRLPVRYALGAQSGVLALRGQGERLLAAPSGPVRGEVALLPALGGTLSTGLSPFTAGLPDTLRRELVPGQLVAALSAQGARLSLAGSRYLDEPVGLDARVSWGTGTVRAAGTLTHPGSRLPAAFDGRSLTVRGAALDARVLRPVLAGAEGRLNLNLTVPNLQVERGSGRATVDLRAADQRATGRVTLAGGQLSADLSSTLAGRALRVRGPLYPQANATVTLDALRATLTGRAGERARDVLTLRVNGAYDNRAVNLTLTGSGLTGGAATVSAEGTLAGAALNLRAAQGAGSGLAAWRLSGGASSADLNTLAGVPGRLSLTLGGTLADVRAQATGEVSGVSFTAPARYSAGQVRLTGAQATLGAAAPVQGTARLSGPVFPTLNLSAKVNLTSVVPGAYTAQIGGALSKPDVRLGGQLRGDLNGLRAAGTGVSARLLGRDYRAVFTGAAIQGEVRGQLSSGALGGLQRLALTLNTAYVAGGVDVRLRGPLGWNARTGFSGSLRAVGDIPGGPLDAVLDGQGELRLAALVGTGPREARLTGRFPAGLPLRPGGTLTLAAFDVGALWGRAEQLRVSGVGTLGGAAWARPSVHFAGDLTDTAGELSGTLTARLDGDTIAAGLVGPQLNGQGSLQGGRYALNLTTGTVRAARLLPAGLDMDALTVAGRLEARGSLSGGLEALEAQNLTIRGEQGQTGPFSLYGRASYQPSTGTLSADLSGSLQGAVVSARGALPAGLTVTARGLGTAALNLPALGRGTLDGRLNLTGAAQNPAAAGELTLRTDTLDAQAALAGRLLNPRLNLRLSPLGTAGGTLYAEASNLDLAAGRVQARVYGSLTSGSNRADVNLAGTWPALSGTVQARVAGLPEALSLRGDGRGSYALSAGRLGSGTLTLGGPGFLPTLNGALTLTPLPLVVGEGDLSARVTVGGTLAAPTVAGTVASRGAAVAGVTLDDLSGTLTAAGSGLNGTLTQGGRTVASLNGGAVTLSGLGARAFGSVLTASGQVGLNGDADVTLDAAGTVAGRVQATWKAQALALRGSLTGPQNLRAALDLSATRLTGWRGTARVSGGPAGVLTAPLILSTSGAFARPLVQGEAGLLGAGARLVADERGVQLRLVDGPTAQASGVIEARPDQGGIWRLLGAAGLTRPELSLSVTPSGPVTDPSLQLSVRRGEWRASGAASLRAADLSVSDGLQSGTLRWNGTQVSAELPGLSLGRLGVGGLGGLLTATGAVSTATQDGRVTVQVSDLTTPYAVPALNLPLNGRLNGEITLRAGQPDVRATLALGSGTLQLQAAQGERFWTGQLTGRVAQGGGTLDLNLNAGAGGVQGRIEAARLPLTLAGQALALSGSATLAGQTFRADLIGTGRMGQAVVTASGGLADLLPALGGPLALAPTGEGYGVRATADDLAISDLVAAPGLSGRVSGEATLRDGGGTFVLRSDDLVVGEKRLPARLEGTQVSGDWRIRGFLGESDFTAGLSGGTVFGQGNLRALPVGAVVGAATGTVPGEGLVTGVARFRFPLADPPAGQVSVVAERIRVSATSGEGESAVTETLTGTGTLEYAARELRGVNIQLTGAGTWDVRGAYTRERVDLTAQLTNTTFTPALRLIPGLAELEPSLKGSVTLSAAGTYDRPRGMVRARSLEGAVAGLSVQIPDLTADLPDSGALTAGAQVLTGGTVGADGVVEVRGQLTLGRLSGAVATFRGLLAPEALGALPNTQVRLEQQPSDRWTVTASSTSTGAAGAGSLTLDGDVAPRLDLTVSARNYNLPLAAIYGRESALNADLRAVDDGSLIRVQGAADFTRLILGRTNAPATIPAPGQSSSGSAGGRPTDDYASPLPAQYTTFPQPQQEEESEAAPSLPILERVVFDDIPVRASSGIRIDENLVRAEFSGGLVLSGTGDRPRLTGEIRSQRGFVYLRENEFTLGDSSVTFSGDNVYPKFNITASGTVSGRTTRGDDAVTQRVPITLTLAGEFVTRPGGREALSLNTTLACTQITAECADPNTGVPYGEAELYALVATGVPNLATLPNNLAALGSSALQTALNVFVLGELERTVAQAFGLDVFRFTPQLLGDNLGATITLGSYLTRDLYLQYQVDLNGQGLLNAEYSTPDGRFVFKVNTPLQGLNLQSIRPSFSAGYNLNTRTNVSLGVQTTEQSTRLRFGITYRIGGR